MTWNITNAPTTDGRVFTINVMVTQGATAYVPTVMSINGNAVTVKWAGNAVPAGTSVSGKIDVFSYTIIRRASAYTVLAQGNSNF